MNRELKIYRLVLGFFIVGLVASGLTAFPLRWEMKLLTTGLGLADATAGATPIGLGQWLMTVREGLDATDAHYPWMAYGTDWLAFAHIIIAIFFIGPWLEPARNIWVLKAGLIACALVIPLALICGPIRGIPFGWRLIDCSFGVLGAVPLYVCWRLAKGMEHKSCSPTPSR